MEQQGKQTINSWCGNTEDDGSCTSKYSAVFFGTLELGFFPDRASKLRAPCTKCPELFSEKIIANKADSSCRAEERVSNRVELNELLAKATVFRDRPRGTERPKQINARRGINYLPAETINAAASERNVHKEGSRTQNSKNNNKISGHNQIYFFILF